jgi:hypothetical protein
MCCRRGFRFLSGRPRLAWPRHPPITVQRTDRLRLQYAPTQQALRDDLYRQFHSLQFDGSTTVVEFNARFNTIIGRLRGLGVNIAETDQMLRIACSVGRLKRDLTGPQLKVQPYE